MVQSNNNGVIIASIIVLCSILAFADAAGALEIVLEPATAQRDVNGKVRVHIYADNAENLISMGVKVGFDPAVLQVVEESTSKYEDVLNGWLMDADGDPNTTDDQYNTPPVEIDNAAGAVIMIGGHLAGESTEGLSGKVLLGWIVFEAVTEGADSRLFVDLARYHPDHPEQKFDNFVNLNGSVDEPTNLGDLGVICVKADACYADIDADGDVDMMDTFKFRQASSSSFPFSNYNPAADFDADGDVDMMDTFQFNNGSPRYDCASCQ